MPVVTSSMPATTSDKGNLLVEMLRKDVSGRNYNRLQKYLMSLEGRKDISRLDSETDILKLWEHVFHRVGPLVEVDREDGLSFSRPIFENILESIPSDISFSPESRLEIKYHILHCVHAIWRKDLILQLVDKNPGRIIDLPDSKGNLFLHDLMDCQSVDPLENDASLNYTNRVYSAFPDAIKHKNKDGLLPLHSCFKYLFRLTELKIDCIEFILSKFPRAASITMDEKGNLPLHMLAECSTKWIYNDEKDEELALKLLQMIYDAYPEAVKACNVNSEYPLHKAFHEYKGNGPPIAIYFLMQKFPQAVFEVNRDLLTPFDYFSLNDDIDFHISSCFLEGLKQHDLPEYMEAMRDERTGNNLLHHFSKKRVRGAYRSEGTKMLRELTLLFPRLTMEKNMNQDVPLLLCLNSGDESTLFEDTQMLVAAMDQQTREEDYQRSYDLLVTPHHRNGLLPFMIAALGKKDSLSKLSCTYSLLQRFVGERGTLLCDVSCSTLTDDQEARKSKKQKLKE